MKALRVHGFGALDAWRLEEIDPPQPASDEVLVRVEAASISYVDLLLARGDYQVRPALPFVPGTEFSGTILGCGAAVAPGLEVGQRVAGTRFGGAWAEQLCVDADALVPIRPDGDPHPASTLGVTGATARYALAERARLVAGETVLVLGAAGGVGLAALQIARALGARVIAASGKAAKRDWLARHDAGIELIDTAPSDWRDALKRLAPDGVDVVFDPVGGALFEPAFRSLRWGGRHLVIGFAEGTIPAIRAHLPLLKGASLVGVDIRQFREREPRAARANLAQVAALHDAGRLAPPIARVAPASHWRAAIEAARDRTTIGRVVLDWTGLSS